MASEGLLRRELMLAGAGLALTDSRTPAWAGPASDRSRPVAGLVLQPGRFAVDRNLTVAGDVLAMPGATIDIAAGAVLTLTGDLICGASRLFAGAGRVDLTRSRLVGARPEWWGAMPDDAKIDCRPALDACLEAHVALQFGPGDYYLADSWVIDRPGRRIWGIGRYKGGRGTRLVVAGDRAAVVRIGPAQAPAAINDYLSGIDVRWLELGRTQPAAAPAGPIEESAAGLVVRNVLDCLFEGIRAEEHAIGFSLRGAVRTYLRDCVAFRSAPSPTPVRDIFIGFDASGAPHAGTTGVNASLYLTDCNASVGGSAPLARSIGLRLAGGIADTFITRLETTSLAQGVVIDGERDTLSAPVARAAHVDVHLNDLVLDGCKQDGIVLADLSSHALVDIRDAYVALGAGGRAALRMERVGGNVSVSGGQLIGWPAGPGSIGVTMSDVAGAALTGMKLQGFTHPVIGEQVSGLDLVIAIHAPDGGKNGAAIALTDCGTSFIRPRISGAAGSFVGGVALAGRLESVSIDVTGVDGAAVGNVRASRAGQALAPGMTDAILVTSPHLT